MKIEMKLDSTDYIFEFVHSFRIFSYMMYNEIDKEIESTFGFVLMLIVETLRYVSTDVYIKSIMYSLMNTIFIFALL